MAPQCLKRGFQQNTETLWILYSHTNNVKKWAYAKSGIRDAGLKLGPTLGTQDPIHTWDLENPQPTKWNLRLCTLIVQETGDLRIFKQKGKHLHFPWAIIKIIANLNKTHSMYFSLCIKIIPFVYNFGTTWVEIMKLSRIIPEHITCRFVLT